MLTMNALSTNAQVAPKAIERRYVSMQMLGCLVLAATCTAISAQADTGRTLDEPYQLREFRHIDREYVGRALERVNELAGRHFGSRLGGQPERDIPLLQRLLDENKVAPDDLQTLQSLGVALGELWRQQRELVWVRYIDGRGVSRALQLKREGFFLYPVTAIARRAAVDAPVDVQAIYDSGLARLDAYVELQRYD